LQEKCRIFQFADSNGPALRLPLAGAQKFKNTVFFVGDIHVFPAEPVHGFIEFP